MNRAGEFEKYRHVYAALPNYRMGELRMVDARADLLWSVKRHCNNYLDIGCGRGEMLDYAADVFGLEAMGTEIVPELCDGVRVRELPIHELDQFGFGAFDFVTAFDVIEHLLPGDDMTLIHQLGRIAGKCLALTANNKPSVDPTTGADLHINKRPYNEWDSIIRGILEPVWTVERQTDKQYVSETWRAWHG
jgi:SAM-dependent methyltransferase